MILRATLALSPPVLNQPYSVSLSLTNSLTLGCIEAVTQAPMRLMSC